MLMGHIDSLPNLGSSKELLLANPVSEIDEDSDSDMQEQIIYTASFEELASKHVQYDTIIWVLISLLLVLAWGVGIFMLLYLPVKRYVLRKDISSRKLYVTRKEVVYKVLRPCFIPCFGVKKIVRRVPLSQVIDIIIEQGCLQSTYGIHTFRIQCIAYGKAAQVDELQVQAVYNPRLLRKVIVSEASKISDDGRHWRTDVHSIDGESTSNVTSVGPTSFRSPSKKSKVAEQKGVINADLVLHKLEEVNQSVKMIEVLIEKSQVTSQNSKM